MEHCCTWQHVKYHSINNTNGRSVSIDKCEQSVDSKELGNKTRGFLSGPTPQDLKILEKFDKLGKLPTAFGLINRTISARETAKRSSDRLRYPYVENGNIKLVMLLYADDRSIAERASLFLFGEKPALKTIMLNISFTSKGINQSTRLIGTKIYSPPNFVHTEWAQHTPGSTRNPPPASQQRPFSPRDPRTTWLIVLQI